MVNYTYIKCVAAITTKKGEGREMCQRCLLTKYDRILEKGEKNHWKDIPVYSGPIYRTPDTRWNG